MWNKSEKSRDKNLHRLHSFVERLSGNNLAKFQPNIIDQVAVDLCTTHQNYTFEKKRKVYFL